MPPYITLTDTIDPLSSSTGLIIHPTPIPSVSIISRSGSESYPDPPFFTITWDIDPSIIIGSKIHPDPVLIFTSGSKINPESKFISFSEEP